MADDALKPYKPFDKARLATTHQGPPVAESKGYKPFDKARLQQAPSALAAAQNLDAAQKAAQTHRPAGTIPLPESAAAQPDFNTINQTPTVSADKAERVALGQALATTGRVGIEVGAGLAGSPVGLAAGKALVRKGLNETGERAFKALGTGLGEAGGSLASQSFDPTGSPVTDAVVAGALGSIAERIGLAFEVGPGSNALLREPGARSTMRLLKGSTPSPSRLTKRTATDIADNILEFSIGTAGQVARRNKAAALRGKEMIYDLVREISGDASQVEVDALMRDIHVGRKDAFKDISRVLFAQFDDLQGVGIPTGPLIKLRNSIVRESTAAISSGEEAIVRAIDRAIGVPENLRGVKRGHIISSTGPRMEMVRPGHPLYNPMFPANRYPIQEAKAQISFPEGQTLRSDLLGFSRDLQDSFASKGQAAADRSSAVVDQTMETAAMAFDPEAFARFREANQFWKDGAEAFGSIAMRALADARPDDAFKMIFRGDNIPQQIREFRKVVFGDIGGDGAGAAELRRRARGRLNDPDASDVSKQIATMQLKQIDEGERAWEKFQGRFLTNILQESDQANGLVTNAATGGKEVVASTALARLNSVGDETLKEIFPGLNGTSMRRQFERLLVAIDSSQKGSGLDVGRMAIQFAQIGMVWGVVTNAVEGDLGTAGLGVMALASPNIMMKLIRKEGFTKWLTIGTKAKPGSEMQRRAIRQTFAMAAAEGARVVDSTGKTINFEEPTEASKGLEETMAVVNSRTGGIR